MNRQLIASLAPGSDRREESWSLLAVARLFVLAAAGGLLIGFFGPFGTFQQMPLGERLLFWLLVLTSAAAVHIPTLWLADRLGAAHGVPTAIRVVAAALLASMPATLFVIGLIAARYGSAEPRPFWPMFGFVFSISLPMEVLSVAVLRLSGKPNMRPESTAEPTPTVPATATAVPTRPPLLDRLPGALGEEILCLEMEDHYVRVHTRLGSTMLLMTMGEAEAQLEGVEGARVHRSWWVARTAIVARETEGRSLRLVLPNGISVPVGRDRQTGFRRLRW